MQGEEVARAGIRMSQSPATRTRTHSPTCQVPAWMLSLDFELGFSQLDMMTRDSMLLGVPLMN